MLHEHDAAVALVALDEAHLRDDTVGGGNHVRNIDLTRRILELAGRPESLIKPVADRPGHDRRYAMDAGKIRALGWRNRVAFGDGLASTVDWFRDNEAWWRAIKSGEWAAYYDRQYGARLAGSSEAV